MTMNKSAFVEGFLKRANEMLQEQQPGPLPNHVPIQTLSNLATGSGSQQLGGDQSSLATILKRISTMGEYSEPLKPRMPFSGM